MPDGTDDNCGIARRQHDAWKRRTVERLTALLDAIARQIDACDDCDRAGQLVYGPAFTPCPKHPNFRQPHIAAMRAKRNALRGPRRMTTARHHALAARLVLAELTYDDDARSRVSIDTQR